MLNLKEADMTQTRFYQEVLQIGRQEGRQEGLQEGLQEGRQEGRQEGLQQEVELILRLLNRRCGEILIEQQNQDDRYPLIP